MNDYLREIFSEINFSEASVLDAGTGRGSAQLLIYNTPKELTCVAYTGDLRKGEKVQEILDGVKNNKYKLVYGDLANTELFSRSSLDYVLGHLLIGELKVGKVEKVISNLYKWLKPNGKIFFTDREYYEEFKPKWEYVSMGEIKGEPQLSDRPTRDLYSLVNLFLNIPSNIQLLTQTERSFDYPSSWVTAWLQNAGFKNIECVHFDSEEKVREEFYERLVWVKERIERMGNEELKKGLSKELEKLTKEFESRNVSGDEVFLRTHFYISAEK